MAYGTVRCFESFGGADETVDLSTAPYPKALRPVSLKKARHYRIGCFAAHEGTEGGRARLGREVRLSHPLSPETGGARRAERRL